MLSRDPVLQELNRRLVAERGVAAAPIVKRSARSRAPMGAIAKSSMMTRYEIDRTHLYHRFHVSLGARRTTISIDRTLSGKSFGLPQSVEAFDSVCMPCSSGGTNTGSSLFYNYHRPHGSLNGKTPYEVLRRENAVDSNTVSRGGSCHILASPNAIKIAVRSAFCALRYSALSAPLR